MKNTNKSDNTKIQLYWNTLIRIPSQGIGFVISILIARILMPEDFGILAVAMMIIGYANTITNFGLNQAIIQKRITDKKVLNSIFTLDFGMSTIFVIIFYFLAGYAAIFFNSPECKDVIRVASVVFIITAFQGVSSSILKRDMDFKTVSIIDVTYGLLCGFLTLILALNHFKYWSLVYGQIIPLLLTTIILCIKARWIPLFQYRHSLMKDVYNFGIWNFIKSQLQFITQHIDKFIIGRFMGPASLGFYDKAISIARMPLQSLTVNINAVMFSSFSEYQDKIIELQNKFRKSLALISIINMPIYAGLIVIAPYFVHVLLGDKWVPMITPFQIILFACIFGSFGGLTASLNVAMGNYKMHTLLVLLSSTIFIISCFLLLKFKLIGISVSFLFFYFVVVSLTMSLAKSKIGVSWKDIILSVLSGFLGSFIMFVVLKCLSVYCFTDYSLQNMIVLVSIGILIYLVYIFIDRTESTGEMRYKILADIKTVLTVLLKGNSIMYSNIEEQRIYYNKRWSQSSFLGELALQRLIVILNAFKKIKIKKPAILDFGCGTGWLSSILNNIGPTTGIDLSGEAIDAAKRMHPSVNYVSGNVFKYSFVKESFDVVVSQEVIEHIDDQKKYLELAASYLKKGSYLILTTPNAFNFRHWDKKMLDSWGMQPIENWLTQKQLRDLLTPLFDILEMRTFISGYGSKGLFRFINASRLNKSLRLLRIKNLFDYVILKLGFGLHILLVAKRK